MAQGQTVSREIDIIQVIKELEKLTAQAQEQKKVVQELSEKQSIRIEKQKQQEENKDSGKSLKKLPTVLTSNERKRYQEIGKRFLLGAEQQFREIKKGIKFKESMKTTKDLFLKGFDKLKQTKQQKSKKSFWAILIGSIVIIGAAATLFHSKISKMLPNLSEQTGGIFGVIGTYVGKLIRGCWDFVTECIGGSISGIFQRIFTESIPNILQIFFFETLPNAIFNTYLAIMAQFDPRANDLLGSGAHDPETASDIQRATADGGQFDAAMQKRYGMGGLIDESLKENGMTLEKLYQNWTEGNQYTEMQYTLMQRHAGELLMMSDVMFNRYEGAAKQSFISMRDGLMKQIAMGFGLGDDNFKKQVEAGNIDINPIVDQILTHQDVTYGQLAEIIKRHARHNESSQDILDRFGGKSAKTKVGGNGLDLDKLSRPYRQLKGGIAFDRASMQNEANRTIMPTQKQVQDRLGHMYNGLGYIGLGVIKDKVAYQANRFLNAANNFVGDGNLSDFINHVDAMVTNLSTSFRNFFGGSLDILRNVMYGIISYTNPKRVPTQFGQTAPKENSSGNGIVTETPNSGIVVNVDMRGNAALSLTNALGELSKKETSVITSITNSIEHLKEIKKTLGQVGEMHALSIQALSQVQDDLRELDKRGEHRHKESTASIQALNNKVDYYHVHHRAPIVITSPPRQAGIFV